MKTVFHKSLTEELWIQKEIDYQILTIAAEFGRAKSAIKRNKISEVQNSMERGLELLDLTKSDPKWKSRLKELTRFREWTGEFYLNQPSNLTECLLLYKFLIQWHPKTANIII